MDTQQMELYRKLGYKGPLAVTARDKALSFAPPGSAGRRDVWKPPNPRAILRNCRR